MFNNNKTGASNCGYTNYCEKINLINNLKFYIINKILYDEIFKILNYYYKWIKNYNLWG